MTVGGIPEGAKCQPERHFRELHILFVERLIRSDRREVNF